MIRKRSKVEDSGGDSAREKLTTEGAMITEEREVENSDEIGGGSDERIRTGDLMIRDSKGEEEREMEELDQK